MGILASPPFSLRPWPTWIPPFLGFYTFFQARGCRFLKRVRRAGAFCERLVGVGAGDRGREGHSKGDADPESWPSCRAMRVGSMFDDNGESMGFQLVNNVVKRPKVDVMNVTGIGRKRED